MKVIYVSNYLNHHSISLCEEWHRLCKEFFFVATDKDRVQGYQYSCDADYVIYYDENKTLVKTLVLDADVVIFGACPNELIALRMAERRLSFLYTERFFKLGTWRRFIPGTRKKVVDRVVKYADQKNLFVLCASAFLPYELSLFGYPSGRCFRWGYFPNCCLTDCSQSKRKRASILWAGRMLDCKHPETAVNIAKRLKKSGIEFTLDFIGDGPEFSAIEKQIKRWHLEDRVRMLGSLAREELLEQMSLHEIFLFTSDRREGWGAVLNEAMTHGCAVVANSSAGAVPYLVDDRTNGRIYRDGEITDAYCAVKELLEDSRLVEMYGNAAKESMKTYNYVTAAERLLEFSEHFLEKGECLYYDRGVFSEAEVMKEDWFKRKS